MGLSVGTKRALAVGLASQAAAEDLTSDLDSMSGMTVTVVDEVVTLTNAVETDMSVEIPAGAMILSVQANLATAVAGDGTGDEGLAAVGIGVTADPDKYGESTALTANSKISTLPTRAPLASAEQITVKATDGSGAAVTEKFTAGGEVRVRVVYAEPVDLADA